MLVIKLAKDVVVVALTSETGCMDWTCIGSKDVVVVALTSETGCMDWTCIALYGHV